MSEGLVVQSKRPLVDPNDGVWGGLNGYEFKARYYHLLELGTLSKSHYVVEFEPYHANSKLSDIDIFVKAGHGVYLPWLATTCNIHVLNAQTDSVQAGHFQQNYVTGNSSDEISINFIETKYGDIFNSAKRIKELMFNADGTQGLPFDYVFWLTVSVHRRDSMTRKAIVSKQLVCLSAANIELDSQGGLVEVPLTFIKTYSMMPERLI